MSDMSYDIVCIMMTESTRIVTLDFPVILLFFINFVILTAGT
jgi:hypothetical protein